MTEMAIAKLGGSAPGPASRACYRPSNLPVWGAAGQARAAIRRPRLDEVAEIEALQRACVRALGRQHHSEAEIENFLRYVGTLDRRLLEDGTYLVAEREGGLVACGGWSLRANFCGGRARSGPGRRLALDPATDAARIRAVFVRPDWVGRGVGQELVARAEAEAAAHGFRRAELMASRTEEPFYAGLGYRVLARVELAVGPATRIPMAHMGRSIGPWPAPAPGARPC